MEAEAREETYRIYVTEALRGISGIGIRYADLFKPEEKRSPDDIKNSIKSKLKQLSEEGEE